MNTIPTLGEIRPFVTAGDPHPEPFTIPLLRLRGHDRPVIMPEDCRLGPSCQVCLWRRAGLFDLPAFVPKTVVGELDYGYTCPSSYCPGCNALLCVCMPEGYEDALAEQAYQLGHEHGTADGPDNRPSRRWLAEANLDADAYLSGYDAACAGVPLVHVGDMPVRLWDELDDGLPF